MPYLAPLLASLAAAAPADAPNLLFIMVDDLGPEWISCYGAEDIETPNVDALAESGMRFTSAYSMPKCTPTRATLLTGQYPFHHGWVNHWDVPRWGAGCHFDPAEYTTFAEILREAGYATGAAGKWQVNDFRVQPDAMRQHGFDDWCMWTGYETGVEASAKRYWNPYLNTPDGSRTYEGRFGTDVFVDFLIGFMREHREDPWALYFPMALTHGPLVPTPAEPDAESPDDKHEAMVRYVDLVVGRLVDAIDELGLREDTIIIFTTDNGTSRGITGTLDGRAVKGGKGLMSENGCAAPFVVNAPGRVPAGIVTDALIDFTDLLPTFAELGGAQIPEGLALDGYSFAPLLTGAADDSVREWILAMGGGVAVRRANGVESRRVHADRAIREKRFKLWVEERRPTRLFDLAADPAEENNLIDSEGEEAVAARERLVATWRAQPTRDASPHYTPVPAQSWDVKVAEEKPPLARPNIVFLYADDHAQRAVGAYGSPLCETPHIDSIAAQGLRFTASFVANSICGPARATILTGLHSHANGKMTNGGGFRDELPSFARILQREGYQTAMVGKWHLSTRPSGFDHWAIARGGYYNLGLETEAGTTPHEGYTTEIITDDALRWLDEARQRDEPFMLWVSHTATHRTWMPGPDYVGRYEGVDVPEPATLFDDYRGRARGAAEAQMRIARDLFPAYDLKLPPTGEGILDERSTQMLARLTDEQRATWDAAYGPRNAAFAAAGLEGDALIRWKYQRYLRDYLRCVDAVDDSVGRVLTYLEETGLDENTIVVYSSDQGFFLGEHGWYDKRWMYEPALATPLLVRWPGQVTPGSASDALVQNIDMAPTFLALAGVEPPKSMHGESLVPLLTGETPDDWRSAIYYHYHQVDSGRTSHTVARHYGVRTDRYKLIHFYDLGEWELYDLANDPDEMKNLFDDPSHAEVVVELRQTLGELRSRYGDTTGQ